MRTERTSAGLVVEVESERETADLGRELAGVVRPGTVIGLVGGLGAGKTRLARAIAEAIGVDPGEIASPTFVLIHEYQGSIPVYHFDAYRIGGPAEFEALGVNEYWDNGGLCLVEWSDRVADLLPSGHWRISIEITGPCSRRLQIVCPTGLGICDQLQERLRDV